MVYNHIGIYLLLDIMFLVVGEVILVSEAVFGLQNQLNISVSLADK